MELYNEDKLKKQKSLSGINMTRIQMKHNVLQTFFVKVLQGHR